MGCGFSRRIHGYWMTEGTTLRTGKFEGSGNLDGAARWTRRPYQGPHLEPRVHLPLLLPRPNNAPFSLIPHLCIVLHVTQIDNLIQNA